MSDANGTSGLWDGIRTDELKVKLKAAHDKLAALEKKKRPLWQRALLPALWAIVAPALVGYAGWAFWAQTQTLITRDVVGDVEVLKTDNITIKNDIKAVGAVQAFQGESLKRIERKIDAW